MSSSAHGWPMLAPDGASVCTVYAIIKEPMMGGQTRTVCGGHKEPHEVFHSTNSSVEIRIVGKKTTDDVSHSFLLKYQSELRLIGRKGCS